MLHSPFCFVVGVLLCLLCSAYALPTAQRLLPYPLHTSGNQIVDSSGNSVRLTCVGWAWYGSYGTAPDTTDFHNYKDMLQNVKAGGFNCVRFCTSDIDVLNNPNIYTIDQSQNPDLYGQKYNDILKTIVAYGGSIGLKWIIDSHNNEGGHSPEDFWGAQQRNGLWYDVGGTTDGTDGGGQQGHISDATFLQVWQTRARIFLGLNAVVGYDIRNEPLAYGGMCTWGDNQVNDIRAMYARVGNAIHAIDSNPLIICEGPQQYGGSFTGSGPAPYGDLTKAKQYPVSLNLANKVVYSVHVYPNSVAHFTPDSGSAVVALYNQAWGYLVTQNIAPVFIGECGDDMQSSDDIGYIQTFISYVNGGQGANGGPTFSGNQQGISWSWWVINPVTGYNNDDAGFGIFKDRSLSSMDPLQQQYWNQILPFQTTISTPAPTPAPTQSPCGATVAAGSANKLVDATRNQWSITAGGQVAQNGQIDQSTSRVKLIAYVSGALWQENADNMWWYKSGSSWLPDLGTPTSPLGACPTPAPTQPPSPSGTVVLAGSGGSIRDAAGNVWTITSGGQVAVNGVADASTGNVVEIAYVNGLVWQENTAKLWYSKTSPTAPWSPTLGTSTSPLPTPAPTQPPTSPSGTVVKAGSGGSIRDASGNVWSINAAGQVVVNGVADTSTANVVEIAYVNGVLWQENTAQLWYGKTSPTAGWLPTFGTSTSPLSTPTQQPTQPPTSPSGTVVLAGSSGSIRDASGNLWTITAGGQVAVNGVPDTSTANVAELAYVNNLVWQENTARLWYSKSSPTAQWLPTFGTSTSPLGGSSTSGVPSTTTTTGSSGGRPPVIAPLQGTVNLGTWSYQTLNGMAYMLLLPSGYSTSVSYPLVLYLHQNDMGTGYYQGNDLLQGQINPWFNNDQFRRNNPCFIVAPLLDQSADLSGNTINFGGYGSGDPTQGEQKSVAIAQYYIANYPVNVNKVYVTGNSMGGSGTWDIMVRYNTINGANGKIFKAGLALAGINYDFGGTSPSAAIVQQMHSVPIGCIHGISDDDQPAQRWEIPMFNAMGGSGTPSTWTRAGTSSMWLLVDPSLGHDVWDTYYSEPTSNTYWAWLFAW